MQLYAIDGNPIPDGAVVGTVVTPDGVRLRYGRWRTTARRSLGTICILHGRGESIEKYFETTADLRRRGFAVATFDWRGQGGSDRHLSNPMKGHVDSFAEYDRDLEAFSQQVMLPDCPPPHYALGHSMGALVALRASAGARSRYARMVLSGPFIAFGPTRPPQPIPCRIAALMTAIGLGEMRGGDGCAIRPAGLRAKVKRVGEAVGRNFEAVRGTGQRGAAVGAGNEQAFEQCAQGAEFIRQGGGGGIERGGFVALAETENRR